MKLRSGYLSKATLILPCLVLLLSLPSAARVKGNSDYGFDCSHTPCADRLSAATSTFVNRITLSGVTMSLDSVWCDSSTSNGTCPDTNFCGATPCPNSTFDYLFDMSIGSGTTLNSLTLNISSGDSNSTIALTDAGVVVFDSSNCGSPGTCPVPFSDPSLTFASQPASISPIAGSSGSYNVTFVGFDATSLGGSGKRIVFYVTAQETPSPSSGIPTPGVLTATSGTPTPTTIPLASSFKSILNIRNLFQGKKTCPTGWSAVGDTGDGNDSFGTTLNLSEQLCANPKTGEFFGDFTIAHTASDVYFGVFNGTFVPSGSILEVHATWRINGGKGQFSGLRGAGTGKGTASAVNGGPGPGSVLLDGSVSIQKDHDEDE